MSAHDMQEAMRSLVLPDSPMIHLAISTVAEMLQSLDANCPTSARDKCFVRCVVAARAVRAGWPIEICRQEYFSSVGSGFDQHAADAALLLPRTDWFGQAKAALEKIGIDPGANARQIAAHYGWKRDTECSESAREAGGGFRGTAIPKPRPRTALERSELAARVALRVKNATPAQRAVLEALRAKSRGSVVPSPLIVSHAVFDVGEAQRLESRG